MLYITRKKGESIIINNDIEITIVEVYGNKVKLGCNFPQDSTILRSEIYQKISESNKSAIDDIENFDSLLGIVKK